VLTALSYIFWVVIALGILVFVHELGHFLFARLFGMRVDAFSLGFPPNIFAKQVGQTEYRIGAVPLGGYVKIAGMIDESLDEGDMVESEPEPDEYRSKPVWQRMLVISGGVIFNVIFAWMVYTGLNLVYGERSTPPENLPLEILPGSFAAELGLQSGDRVYALNGEPVERLEAALNPLTLSDENLRLTVVRGIDTVTVTGMEGALTRFSRAQREAEEAGEEDAPGAITGIVARRPTIVSSVNPGSAADEAGLRPNDRVLSIDGEAVASWEAMTEAVRESNGRPLAVVVERGGALDTVNVTPREAGGSYVLGVISDPNVVGSKLRDLGLGESASLGAEQTVGMLGMYFGFVGKLVSGRESFRENVGGPVMIAKQAKEAADIGGIAFWNIVATLSIALAVFNILPVPVLDGGHLVFLAYEGIVRREPSLKFRIAVQKAGMVALLALMVFVIFNDAVRIFG